MSEIGTTLEKMRRTGVPKRMRVKPRDACRFAVVFDEAPYRIAPARHVTTLQLFSPSVGAALARDVSLARSAHRSRGRGRLAPELGLGRNSKTGAAPALRAGGGD